MNFQLCSVVFTTFKKSWKKFIHSVCLSVHVSVCARSNWRKYSWIVFKFIHAIHIWHKTHSIENNMYGIKGSFKETHKSLPIHFDLWKGEFLKLIVSCLYCTKYNETSIFHSVVQKHSSWTVTHKRFLIYYGLCLETAGYVFEIVFLGLFPSY